MNNRDLDHLRTNSMIRFKTEDVGAHSVEIVSYMIGDKELWDDPAALETRGNSYDVQSGECVCACFPKFFNLGERQDTQPDIVKDSFIEVFEKRDGSMVTPVLIDGNIYWKTKKSFYSEVAKIAQATAPTNVQQMAVRCQFMGYTPIFEFTHPDTRIVLDYGNEPIFTLIAIRNNETGEFLSWLYVERLIAEFSLHAVKKYEKTWEELMHDVEHAVGIEGYVLVLEDGRRVKLKTAWYLQQHRLMTDLRERDVAEAAIDETLDDIKSQMTSANINLDEIEMIETRVAGEVASLREQVNQIILLQSDKSIKEVAIEMKQHPLFSLIMSEVRGKEADYTGYWKRNFLSNYSLRSVRNPNF